MTTPRAVKTTELASPDFRKPATTETKEPVDDKEKAAYTPEKAAEGVAPTPTHAELPAQVLMSLLKDVAEGQSKCRRGLATSNESHDGVYKPSSSRFQRRSQVWKTTGKGAGQDQEGLRDPQEDEGGLERLDQADPGALQPQGEAVRGSSSGLDFGVTRCTHGREGSKGQLESSWPILTPRSFGGFRARREGLASGVRGCSDSHGCRRVYGVERALTTEAHGVASRPTALRKVGRSSPRSQGERGVGKGKSKTGQVGKEEKKRKVQPLGKWSLAHQNEEEHFERERSTYETREVTVPTEGQSIRRTWRWRGGGQDRGRCYLEHGDPDVPLARPGIHEYSYTDAFRARVETLRQQRRAAEDYGDDPAEEGEESEEEEDEGGRRTPEEQRDLEASIVYFSQGFRVLLLRHQVLRGDSLYHIFHIPAEWQPARTASVIEGLWTDLAHKQWLLIYARDPTRDSMVLRPAEVAALVVVRDELPPNQIPIAQEIDFTAHSSSFRQQDISQEFRTQQNSRGKLLKLSGHFNFCDASQRDRQWHCYVYVDGVAWLDEIERTLRPGSHVLIRINPRQDLPAEDFFLAHDETIPFAVADFPIRSIYTTVAFHPPWSIHANVQLDDYNQQTWFLHDLGRVAAQWWTIWGMPSDARAEVSYLQTPTQRTAWKTLDTVIRSWPDLDTSLWELVEPHQYWRAAPTLRHHEYLVLLLNKIDTNKGDSLIVCEFLPTWPAWLWNVHRPITYEDALQLFLSEVGPVADLQRGQLWLNGVPRDRAQGDLHLDHGDILSISCPSSQSTAAADEVIEVVDTDFMEEGPDVTPAGLHQPRAPPTGPMSHIASLPNPSDHAFQPDHAMDSESGIATFTFTWC